MPTLNEWSTQALAALPVKNGFRQRGMEMTRLETFTDAAFAFAVTLLVVGGGDAIPLELDEMMDAMKQVPAFAASFANIMLFWYAHHIWSRRFGLDDAGSAFLSLLLIFIVLIYVYPLKAIYSGALTFFSGGYFPSYFKVENPDGLRTMFVIFGVGYVALSGVIVLLNRHALAKRDELVLSDLEQFDTMTQIGQWVINMLIPAASVAIALTVSGQWVILAGLVYMLFGITLPWHAIKRDRQRDEMLKQ